MTQRNPDPQKEILSRARRIETRLTTLMIRLGLDGEGQKPEFVDGRTPGVELDRRSVIHLPSIDCSMKSILDAAPDGFRGMVDVMIGADRVTTLVLGDRT